MTSKVVNRLIIILITAVLMILILFEWDLGLVRVLFAIGLVTILPGYALTTAIFINYPLGFIEKIAFSFGFSLGLTSLGGIVLHFTPWGMQPVLWVALLGGVALLASFVALLRMALGTEVDVSVVQMPFRLSDVILLGLAGLIIVGAYVVAREGALHRPVAPYTQLWLLWEDEEAQVVQVGFHNWEQKEVMYQLELRHSHGRVVQFPPITLPPNTTWQLTHPLPPPVVAQDFIQAALYRLDQPDQIYREAYLRRISD